MKLQFSDRPLQIFDIEDYACSKFHLLRKVGMPLNFPKMGYFQPQIVVFFRRKFSDK